LKLALTAEDQETLMAWAAPRCGIANSTFPFGSFAVAVTEADTGNIRAVVIYVPTYGREMDIHFATDRSRLWASRSVLSGVFGFAFTVRGATRLVGRGSVNNPELLSLMIRTGWQIEGRERGYMDDGSDAIVFTMRPEECPWIKEKQNGR